MPVSPKAQAFASPSPSLLLTIFLQVLLCSSMTIAKCCPSPTSPTMAATAEGRTRTAPPLRAPTRSSSHQDTDAQEHLLIVSLRPSPSCPPPLPLVSHQQPRPSHFHLSIAILAEPGLRASVSHHRREPDDPAAPSNGARHTAYQASLLSHCRSRV